MKYPSIRIEGAILSADILDKIEQGDLPGQKTKDFGFTGSNVRVKDEIVRAWADAQDMWRIFNRKMDALPDHKAGTTETRNFWIVPLLGLLGYEVERYRKAQDINGKTYAISHYANNIDHFPIHIMGFRDSLDKKRQDSGPRMSPHALIQEYINLHEHLFAVVTNGLSIRLLRDSSRLIKLSFVEFDLERMFEEEHFADFALLFRLIHFSRMPGKQAEGPESFIEGYHQDSLDSGSRIRDGLSKAVEHSIRSMANGFLSHRDNTVLRQAIIDGDLLAKDFYQSQLRLIYRLLFLMVIEERDLIFTKSTPRLKKDIYYNYYSVGRLRKLSEKRYLADKRYRDVWISLKNTFKLYETSFYGEKLDIQPLAGDLFSADSIGFLSQCQLNNKVLLECLNNLSVFTNPDTHQKMRVNYASLNVEEFGSVYEGLLEYDPVLDVAGETVEFRLVKGSARSSSGSHYTPDELVQPLIKHSLNYIIEDKLKESNPGQALLSITVCDVACGSGHFLLGAARRIATELAKVRTGEDQPSPSAFRESVRDVIRHCIYGVDINPLAVELARVALWLEAHNPGEPLNFLDHKIKCGDAVVGLTHIHELDKGIADEAFKKLPGDDETSRTLAKKNKQEKQTRQRAIDFEKEVTQKIDDVNLGYAKFSEMPESTPDEISEKQKAYQQLSSGANWWRLKTLADIQTAQFFIPKTIEHADRLITESTYRDLLRGSKPMQGSLAIAKSTAIASKIRFFHWFLEFPEVFSKGGFDCIIGNPPFLGGATISTHYGHNLTNYLYSEYSPAKNRADLVVYFVRRAAAIVNNYGFISLISTNSIAEGDSKEGGLEYLINNEYEIIFANRSIIWPGISANLYVSLFSLCKGRWSRERYLDNRKVSFISEYFEDYKNLGNPRRLYSNSKKMYLGSKFLGDGFILERDEGATLLGTGKNSKVIFPLINGRELNNSVEEEFERYIINFWNWPQSKAKSYKEVFSIIEERVKPERDESSDKNAKEKWWLYARPRIELYDKLKSFKKCFVSARTTKHLNFSFVTTNAIYTDALCVLADDSYSTFLLLQSGIHNEWARKYSSKLKTDLRYSNTDAFETFPIYSIKNDIALDEEFALKFLNTRNKLKVHFDIGLTKLLNLVHDPNCTEHAIQKFRGMIKDLDEIVLTKFNWCDLELVHDFYEVDYLPENDRVRYTISPEARKEVLKRLLLLNHEIYEEELNQGLHGKKKTPKDAVKKKSKIVNDPDQGSLFSGKSVTPNTATRQKVSHPKFGEGVVLDTDGHGENAKLTIQFDSGEKKLMAKFVTHVNANTDT